MYLDPHTCEARKHLADGHPALHHAWSPKVLPSPITRTLTLRNNIISEGKFLEGKDYAFLLKSCTPTSARIYTVPYTIKCQCVYQIDFNASSLYVKNFT